MKRRALPPSVIQLVPKHGFKDCMISALAAYLQHPYEEVLIAAAAVRASCWKNGLAPHEAITIAKRLGHSVRWTREFDIDEDTGVLGIGYNDSRREHVVLLVEGRIYELEDQPVTVWSPDVYLTYFNAKTALLLVKETRDGQA